MLAQIASRSGILHIDVPSYSLLEFAATTIAFEDMDMLSFVNLNFGLIKEAIHTRFPILLRACYKVLIFFCHSPLKFNTY